MRSLFADLLISVTTFFRDPAAFDVLAGQIILRLFEGNDAGEAVRVWIPGCATGEEAYSIAMLLLEEASRHDPSPLQHLGGAPTTEVAELIRPELRMDLRSALYRALEQGQASLSLPIPVQFNGKPQRVYMQVRPVTGQDKARTALVLFVEGGVMEHPVTTNETEAGEDGRAESLTIQRLQDELQATRMRLKASHEEQEAANEELRAASCSRSTRSTPRPPRSCRRSTTS